MKESPEGSKGFKEGIWFGQNLSVEFFGASHDISNGDHVGLHLNVLHILDK